MTQQMRVFKKRFIKSLNKQAIHLINVFKKKKLGSEKIFTAKAIIISALSFRNLSSKLKIGIKLLIDTLNSDIMEDGMHYLRSPSEQFIFTVIDRYKKLPRVIKNCNTKGVK